MEPSHRNKTAIVGVGSTSVVRYGTRSVTSLAIDAALAAVEDAGLKPGDVDGIVGSPGAPNASAANLQGVDEVSSRLLAHAGGFSGVRFDMDVSSGLPNTALAVAAMAVASGACNVCLVVRSMYNPAGVRYGEIDSAQIGGPTQYTTPYGLDFAVGKNAMWARRYMHDYGADKEDLFHVVRAARHNAQHNRTAYWHGKGELSEADYFEAKMVSDPLCVLDCDMPVTAAGAVVVTTAARARALPHPPAYISGFCNTTLPGEEIYRVSGVAPDELAFALIYDGFSPYIWWGLERWGLCKKGEGYQMATFDRIRVGGEFPINPHGGSLGEGRLHGMGHLREGVLQVMGRCGERQVVGANRCLIVGGFEWRPCHVLMLSAA